MKKVILTRDLIVESFECNDVVHVHNGEIRLINTTRDEKGNERYFETVALIYPLPGDIIKVEDINTPSPLPSVKKILDIVTSYVDIPDIKIDQVRDALVKELSGENHE